MKRLAFLALLASCNKPAQPAPLADAGDASSATNVASRASPVALAEDLRHASQIDPRQSTSHDVAERRRSARAFARIADASSLEGLMAHLADEDPVTVAWAAYGLGFACKGHEEAHVRALAARAATLSATAEARSVATARGEAELDVYVSIARAIGRCGSGPLGERVLVSLLGAGPAWHVPALFGLGDLATKRKELGGEAMTALVEASAKSDEAFFALSRADAGEVFGKRVADAARAALTRQSDYRVLAIKSLGRVTKSVPKDAAKEIAAALVAVVVDTKNFTPAERAEAARALGTLGDGGLAAADALGKLAPDRNDAVAIPALLGPEFGVLYTLIASVGAEPPKVAEPFLRVLSNLAPPADPKAGLARRIAHLRCSAALGLARGVYDAEVLRKCDVDTSVISQTARLTSLLRRPLAGERKNVFRSFAKSDHLVVREQAVEAIGDHPELADLAATILAEALASKHAGLVATAAEVLHVHPERAMVLADSEKRAALDPHAPPPTGDPAQELSKDVAKALGAALAEKWPEDRFETRIALVDAAASTHHPQAKAAANAACADANAVVRERAQKALRALGENVAACNVQGKDAIAAPEIGKTRTATTKIVFMTDAPAELTIFLEPDLAPITATRIASLVSSGFYKGVVVHRVVPAFVAQLGDPEGDGYGGSGTSLRCETSPVPFEPLDVGMALAGRDTGSSQIFVTLSRTPHLDGDYTRVGRATGDWASVAQGDTIVDARVLE